MKTFLRQEDIVARFGREEFVCVTSNKKVSDIHALIKKLQKRLNEEQILHAESSVPEYLTISIGSIMSKDNLEPVEELIRQADNALYKAKRRNCHVHTQDY